MTCFNAGETAEAKRITEAERLLEEGEAKCFVVMGSRAELAQIPGCQGASRGGANEGGRHGMGH